MSSTSLIEVADIAEEPVAEPAPADAAPEPVAAPVVEPPSPLWRALPLVAVSLAAVASLLSAVGLVVASRTVAGAALVVADARERQAQLAQVGVLVDEVQKLRVRELAALERMERFRSGGAATPDDLNRAIDGLRQSLVRHDPEGGPLSLVRDGQAELADRIGQISLKLGRIEEKLKAAAHP
jgi:hypothetical protein